MAGAGYKLFNTGDVLTAQQVNEYLQQQTVMVFADSSARTTALSGVLAEGMVSYLKSTDATEVYNGSAWVALAADQTPLTTKGDLFTYSTADTRLAVGADGTYLQADSTTATGLKWGTVSAGGMTLLSTTTLSGTSTTVSGISGAYNNLFIVLENVTWNTGSTQLTITTNSMGTDGAYGVLRSPTSASNGSGQSALPLTPGRDSHRTNGFKSNLIFFDYSSTVANKNVESMTYYYDVTTAAYATAFVHYGFFQASAITSITLGNNAGYTFSGGSIKIYGVK